MTGSLARALEEAATLVLVALVLGLVSNHFSPRPACLRGRTPRAIPVVSTLALPQARALQQAGSMLFLDAREPEAFREGHIPGAISVPTGKVEEALTRHQDRLAGSVGFVIYCDRRDGAPSRAVARALGEHGFGNLYLLPGGWSDWRAAGLPSKEGES